MGAKECFGDHTTQQISQRMLQRSHHTTDLMCEMCGSQEAKDHLGVGQEKEREQSVMVGTF